MVDIFKPSPWSTQGMQNAMRYNQDPAGMQNINQDSKESIFQDVYNDKIDLYFQTSMNITSRCFEYLLKHDKKWGDILLQQAKEKYNIPAGFQSKIFEVLWEIDREEMRK